jgi:RNA polymerase sigma-70 factor (ECF subfamily)
MVLRFGGEKFFERNASLFASYRCMSCVMTLLVEDPIPTRYTLLSRLEDRGDQDSWKDFFDTYWRLIYSVALKSGLTEAEAQDVVQETIISVARDIHKFERDRALGSFKGWLRNIIRWRIADQLRKRTRASWGNAPKTGADLPQPDMAEIPDPAGEGAESVWEEEWRANLLKAAMETIKSRVKEEHYQIFDLYVIKQWPVRNVARALRVNVGLVYLVKYRISALLKKEVRRLEGKWNQA